MECFSSRTTLCALQPRVFSVTHLLEDRLILAMFCLKIQQQQQHNNNNNCDAPDACIQSDLQCR